MRSLRVKKRIIGVSTLILAIVLANIPIFSRAARPDINPKTGTCGVNVKYTLEDASSGSDYYKLIIEPENAGETGQMSGYVRGEAPWSSVAAYITELELSDRITEIGASAFYGTAITSVPNLTNVTMIGDYAFADCKQMKGNASINCDVNLSSFENCESLEYISFGSGVKRIREKAFSGCTSLRVGSQQFITSEVETIGKRAFYNCKALDGDFITPSSLSSIGEEAFTSCESLKSINLSAGTVVEILPRTFQNCKAVTSLEIPTRIWNIGDYAFATCANLKTLKLNEGLTSVGIGVFSDCISLTEVSIPSSLTKVGDLMFYNCGGLTSVTFQDSLKEIGQEAFRSCGVLKDGLTIPKNVDLIGKLAFESTGTLNNFYFDGDEPSAFRAETDDRSFDPTDVMYFVPNAQWTSDAMSSYGDGKARWKGYYVYPRPDNKELFVEDSGRISAPDENVIKAGAKFVTPGTGGVTFNSSDHTLVIKELSSNENSDLRGYLNAAGLIDSPKSVMINDVKLFQYYGTGFEKEVKEFLYDLDQDGTPEEPASIQVTIPLPSVMDIKTGTIEGVYSTTADGSSYEPITFSIVQRPDNNGNGSYDCVMFETTHFSEIGIVYNGNLAPFSINDRRRDPKPNSDRIAAGFVSGTGEPANTSGYKLVISDDTGNGDALNSRGLQYDDQTQVFGVYDIYLTVDTNSGTEYRSDNFGTLSITVPVPAAVNEKMKEDAAANSGSIGTLEVYSAENGNQYAIVPFYRVDFANGDYGIRFDRDHFILPNTGADSEFGFRYTELDPVNNPQPFRYEYTLSDPANIIRDNTVSAVVVDSSKYNELRGTYLEITEVTPDDSLSSTTLGGEILPIGMDERLNVYKITLRRQSDDSEVSGQYPELQVRIPVPDEMDISANSEGTARGTLKSGHADEGEVITEGFGFIDNIGGTNCLRVNISRNGEVSLLYTPTDPSLLTDSFKIIENWTINDYHDRQLIEVDKTLTASYTNNDSFKGWKLYVDKAADAAYTTFRDILDLDDDQELYVVNFDLVDATSGTDVEVNAPDSPKLHVMMPILGHMAETSWDLSNGTIQLYRYDRNNSGVASVLDGFNPQETYVDGTRCYEFDLENIYGERLTGEVAVVYTPDRTRDPFTVDATNSDNPTGFYASFGADKDPNYAGYVLEITNADATAFDDVINTSGMPVKAYTYTLRNKQTGEAVTNYADPLTVRMTIPTSTGTGADKVDWVLGEPDEEGKGILYGVISYTGSGTSKELDTSPLTNTVPYGDTQVQFIISRNGDYGLQYRPNPQIEFEVIDRINSSASVVGDGKTTRQTTYARSYPSYTDNRYLIFYDSTQRAIKPLIDADDRYKDYLDIAIYDIFFQDQRNNGDDKTDHGTVQIGMQLPTNMHITDTLKVGVLTMLNGQLEELETKNFTDTQTIRFDASHFSEYALLYFDSASNSSTNASTGDSSATNASTGSSDGSTAGTTATGATTDSSSTATTATGATTSSATGSTTSTGATTGTSSSTGATTGSSATGSTTGSSSSTNASTGSTIPTAYTTNPSSGSRPDMPKTGDPGMYRMMGSAGLGLFGIYELISSIRVREKGGKRRLYRR